MSYNTSAIQTVYDMTNYEPRFRQLYTNVDCLFGTTDTASNVAFCQNQISSDPVLVNKIVTHDSYTFNAGDIIEFYIVAASAYNGNRFDVITSSPANTANLRILGFEDVTSNNIIDVGLLDINTGEIFTSAHISKVYKYTFYVINNFSGQIGLQAYNYTTRPIYVIDGVMNFTIIDLAVYRSINGGSSKDQQNEINATNDSVQQSEDAGDSSQSDTDTATQSLMSAGANIISALTSAPATDCNINISTTGNSSAFTSAIGNLNLCSDVPSGVLTLVQGMVALVFTPLVLYYVYSILTLIYAQFKEYNS